jgi:hypothetical protein
MILREPRGETAMPVLASLVATRASAQWLVAVAMMAPTCRNTGGIDRRRTVTPRREPTEEPKLLRRRGLLL